MGNYFVMKLNSVSYHSSSCVGGWRFPGTLPNWLWIFWQKYTRMYRWIQTGLWTYLYLRWLYDIIIIIFITYKAEGDHDMCL